MRTIEEEATALRPSEDMRDLPRVLGVYPAPEAERPAGPGEKKGTLFFVVGGIHGNEPAGVRAIRAVFRALEQERPPIAGRVVGLAGNTVALAAGRRYVEHDLNRLWTEERLAPLERRDPTLERAEEREQRALLDVFQRHLAAGWERVVLLDLHSTSAGGAPFSIMSDTLQNRPVAFALGVPVILGLEERVEGTLLAWFSDRGHVALCLEGGQNEHPATADHHEAAVWVTLVSAGLLSATDVPALQRSRALLAASAEGLPQVVEIRYRYGIPHGARFAMRPGYENFQAVGRGEVMAALDEGQGPRDVLCPLTARVLMPRYQALGDDGFFLGREVKRFWLDLSGVLRRARLEWILPFLPGIRRDPAHADQLIADRRIARWLSVQVLHLFGYRRRSRDGQRVVFVRRPDAL